MRVAAIYDIHGNIDALDAVLLEVASQRIDRIVVGGDIAWGPFPSEVVRRVQDLEPAPAVIRGNADREVAARADESDGLQDWVAEVNTWCADRLTSDERHYLSSLPQTATVHVEGLASILFCHSTPRSDEEIVTPNTPDEDVLEILEEVRHDLIVCGHTHSQFDRTIDDRRLVNAGSVGLPYEDAPGAYWAIVGPDVTLMRADYDFAGTAARVRNSDCPHAERFAAAITSPVPRSTAIENFEKQRSSS